MATLASIALSQILWFPTLPSQSASFLDASKRGKEELLCQGGLRAVDGGSPASAPALTMLPTG